MKPIPIALAVGLAGLTLWRWGRLTWLVRAAAALACGALVVYGAGAVHLPGLETMVATIGSTLGPYTYALVAVMAFLETGAFVGLLVPGETVVIVGGVVAGQGHVEVLILLGLTWACALGGDLTGYLLGRRLGRQFLLKHGPRVHITEPRLARVEAFFARYGLATILAGRFAGLVRPVAPFLAGASRYPPGRFTAAAVAGTGLWSTAFVLLGYLFWQSIDQAIAIAKRGSLALAGTVALLVCLVVVYRHVRGRHRLEPDRGLDNRAPAARGELDAPRQERSRVANAPEAQAASERGGRRVSPRLRAHERARAEDAA
jgi:membrane protein DedA with SNARE-associated domain